MDETLLSEWVALLKLHVASLQSNNSALLILDRSDDDNSKPQDKGDGRDDEDSQHKVLDRGNILDQPTNDNHTEKWISVASG